MQPKLQSLCKPVPALETPSTVFMQSRGFAVFAKPKTSKPCDFTGNQLSPRLCSAAHGQWWAGWGTWGGGGGTISVGLVDTFMRSAILPGQGQSWLAVLVWG